MSIYNLVAVPKKPYLLGSDSSLGRQTQYFAQESIDFIQSLGAYANNHYIIQIQKWGEDIETVPCRITDSFDELANTKRGDDWKKIIFYEPIDNITVGMLAWFEDNTWLGFNTRNIASLTSSITVRRCDNVLNIKDEFNNIYPVPFVFDKYTVLNSTPVEKPSEPISLINGYKNAWVQYNEYTATVRTNDRFIINGQAWTVRGIDSVGRQYTDGRNSVRIMAFVLTRSEERDDDDLENDIADVHANVWLITPNITEISGSVGDSGAISSTLTRNGNTNTTYSVLYTSSNEDVVTVDENGNYSIVGDGTATIRCSFEKNYNIYADISVTATASALTASSGASQNNSYAVRFDSIPQTIKQYASVTLSAYLYLNNAVTGEVVAFDISGVPQKYYEVTAHTTNSITIKCKAPYSKNKLKITARAETNDTSYSNTISVRLVSIF